MSKEEWLSPKQEEALQRAKIIISTKKDGNWEAVTELLAPDEIEKRIKSLEAKLASGEIEDFSTSESAT